MKRLLAHAILLTLAAGLALQTILVGAPTGLAWRAVFGSAIAALVAVAWASASALTVFLRPGANRRSAAAVVISFAIANGLLAFPAFGVLTGMWVFSAWASVAYIAFFTAMGDI